MGVTKLTLLTFSLLSIWQKILSITGHLLVFHMNHMEFKHKHGCIQNMPLRAGSGGISGLFVPRPIFAFHCYHLPMVDTLCLGFNATSLHLFAFKTSLYLRPYVTRRYATETCAVSIQPSTWVHLSNEPIKRLQVWQVLAVSRGRWTCDGAPAEFGGVALEATGGKTTFFCTWIQQRPTGLLSFLSFRRRRRGQTRSSRPESLVYVFFLQFCSACKRGTVNRLQRLLNGVNLRRDKGL